MTFLWPSATKAATILVPTGTARILDFDFKEFKERKDQCSLLYLGICYKLLRCINYQLVQTLITYFHILNGVRSGLVYHDGPEQRRLFCFWREIRQVTLLQTPMMNVPTI